MEPSLKSVRSQSFSGPYFLVFGLNSERYGISLYSVRMRENTNQENSKYEHFSRRGNVAFSLSALSTEKTVFQFFQKGFPFFENLFQGQIIENVQNF